MSTKKVLALIFFLGLVAGIFPLTGTDLINLNDNSTILFQGAAAGDYFGCSVSNAGDINGDGIDDIIIGAMNADSPGFSDSGAVYVIFGNKSELVGIDLANTTNNTTQGFKIQGPSFMAYLGISAKYAGDMNDDGISDIIFSAPTAGLPGMPSAGIVYIVFGKRNGFNDIDLASNSWGGMQGIKILGAMTNSYLGWSVDHAGDINGDGISDVVIGAPLAAPEGRDSAGIAYIIYGNKTGLIDINLTNGLDNTQGIKIKGDLPGDRFGYSVSHLGDINSDGIDDIIIGAPIASRAGLTNMGLAYIIFGKKSGLTDIDLANGLSSSQGYKILGVGSGDGLGLSVSSAGDINGDGINDVLIGARLADPLGRGNAGAAYVIFGNQSESVDIDLANGLNSTRGFEIQGNNTGDQVGWSVSFGGDMNGDGISDIIVGGAGFDPPGMTDAGIAYVIFGNKTELHDIDLANPPNNSWGFGVQGNASGDYFGYSVSYAGDVNGDEGGDIIISAYQANPSERDDAGTVYIIFGVPVIKPTENFSNDSTGIGINNTLYKPNANNISIETIIGVQDSATKASKLVSKIITAINFSNPATVMICLVGKMFRAFKYAKIKYSLRLQEMLDQPEPSIISIEGITSAPESLEDVMTKHNLPINFEKYEDQLHSSFLINFWSSLSTIWILAAATIVISILERFITKSPRTKLVCSKIKNMIKWNFLLATVIEYYGDTALYTAFEMRTAAFEAFLEGSSFVLCLLINLAGVGIFFKMVTILRILAQAKKDQSTDGDNCHLESLKNQFKAYEVIFEGFKDGSFLQQSFLIWFILRIYVFYSVIAYLFDYPLLQTTFISLTGLVFLVYLLFERPLKDKVDLFSYIGQEIILQIICMCFTVLAVIDATGTDPSQRNREIIGDIILYCITTFMAMSLTYQFIQIIIILQKLLQVLKNHWRKKRLPRLSANVRTIREDRILSHTKVDSQTETINNSTTNFFMLNQSKSDDVFKNELDYSVHLSTPDNVINQQLSSTEVKNLSILDQKSESTLIKKISTYDMGRLLFRQRISANIHRLPASDEEKIKSENISYADFTQQGNILPDLNLEDKDDAVRKL